MSKFTRPILTDIYPRRRLFDMLDRMRKKPLIWVSGPGGCGKTTLVSSYLEARKIPCLWYQVDEGDKEPATMEGRIDPQQTLPSGTFRVYFSYQLGLGVKIFLDISSNDEYIKGASMQINIQLIPHGICSCQRLPPPECPIFRLLPVRGRPS